MSLMNLTTAEEWIIIHIDIILALTTFQLVRWKSNFFIFNQITLATFLWALLYQFFYEDRWSCFMFFLTMLYVSCVIIVLIPTLIFGQKGTVNVVYLTPSCWLGNVFIFIIFHKRMDIVFISALKRKPDPMKLEIRYNINECTLKKLGEIMGWKWCWWTYMEHSSF